MHHSLASSADQHSVVSVFASIAGAVWCSHQAQHLAGSHRFQRCVYRSLFASVSVFVSELYIFSF